MEEYWNECRCLYGASSEHSVNALHMPTCPIYRREVEAFIANGMNVKHKAFEVINYDGEFSIDTKRFYVPAKIIGTCDSCGGSIQTDYSDNYLMHPCANTVINTSINCYDCGIETSIKIKLSITISLVE